MQGFDRIVFVDEENTRLSPYAECLFKKKAGESGLGIDAVSRGLVVLFPEPVNQAIAEIAAEQKIFLNGYQAKALEKDDLDGNCLVLTMDMVSKARVCDISEDIPNVYTIREYVGESGDIKIQVGETSNGYRTTCERLEKLIDNLINKLIEIEKEENEVNEK